jgi:hypothetical protein
MSGGLGCLSREKQSGAEGGEARCGGGSEAARVACVFSCFIFVLF